MRKTSKGMLTVGRVPNCQIGSRDEEIEGAFKLHLKRKVSVAVLRQVTSSPYVYNAFDPRTQQEAIQRAEDIEPTASLLATANDPKKAWVWARAWLVARSSRYNFPSLRAAHILLSRRLGLKCASPGLIMPACTFCGEQTRGGCRKMLPSVGAGAPAFCGLPLCAKCQKHVGTFCERCRPRASS